jgi:3-hydroxymyristoyl/3-hydroxydecanoyl-(acyl carrier protein) dehydratase
LAHTELFFSAPHRSAEGHFPGNPIIPGALLLSETLAAIGRHLAVGLKPVRIKTAKFFHPTRPGDLVSIDYAVTPPGDINFTCTVGDNIVLRGQTSCDTQPKTT